MRGTLTLLLGLSAGFAVMIAANAGGAQNVTICGSELSSVATTSCAALPSFSLRAGVAPTTLPRRGYAPIRVGAAGRIEYGSKPALRAITIEIDRHAAIDVEGLPSCSRKRLEALGANAGPGACSSSVVGTGVANFQASPESIRAPLVFFNSAAPGRPGKLLVQADLPPPFGPIFSAMKIAPIRRGRYGMKAVLPIPAIDEGAVRLSEFKFHIHRLFSYEGRKESYAAARCPKGDLAARISIRFSDGTKLVDTLDLPCTPGSRR
jgi:hypothetical protein